MDEWTPLPAGMLLALLTAALTSTSAASTSNLRRYTSASAPNRTFTATFTARNAAAAKAAHQALLGNQGRGGGRGRGMSGGGRDGGRGGYP